MQIIFKMIKNKNVTIIAKSEPFINFMKCFLIIGVVAIHSDINYQGPPDINLTGSYIATFFSQKLAAVVVPCFFILSGYLYFRNIKVFDFQVYKKKLKSRIYTLVIPYILWNFLDLACYLIKYYLIESNTDCLSLFQVIKDGYPYAFAFWFIRNLIFFVLISPAAYLIGGLNKWILIAFLLILMGFNIPLGGFEYFTIGCGITRFVPDSFFNLPSLKIWILISLWLIFSIIILFIDFDRFFISVKITMTICAFFGLYNFFKKYYTRLVNKITLSVVASTFYIYALHQFLCFPVKNLFIKIFGVTTFWESMTAYFGNFLAVLVLSYSIWLLMKHTLPRLTNILSGNR